MRYAELAPGRFKELVAMRPMLTFEFATPIALLRCLSGSALLGKLVAMLEGKVEP